MTRTWKQTTANMLVLVSLSGQLALAGGHGGFSGGHQGAGSHNIASRPNFSFQPSVNKATTSFAGGNNSFQNVQKFNVTKTPIKVQTPHFGQVVNNPISGGQKFKPLNPITVLPPSNVKPPFGPIGPIKPPTNKPPTVNPLPPLGPIGPIKPPTVKPPKVDPFPPIGPIGPIKPPKGPGVIVDPIFPHNPNGCGKGWCGNGGLGCGNWGSGCGNWGYGCGNWGYGCGYWGGWLGCLGGFNYPLVTPYPLPVCTPTYVTQPVSVVEVVPASPTIVVKEVAPDLPPLPTSAREIDLGVKEVRVLEKGDAQNGPLFRVVVTNKGPMNLDKPTRVALLAVKDGQPTADTPRLIETMTSLNVGETKELDMRLPATASSFPGLLVAVEIPESFKDVNEQDNLAQGEVARLPFVASAIK